MSMKQILIIEEEDGSKTILGAPEKKNGRNGGSWKNI